VSDPSPDMPPSPRPKRIEPTTVECVVTPLPWRAWGAIAATLLALATLVWFNTPKVIWPDPAALAPIHEFAQNERDHSVFVLEHARSPERDQADVLILGSSVPLAALWDEATLDKVGGARFINLSSSAQNPLESMFLLQQRPLRHGQMVVLYVGVSLLGLPEYGRRLEAGEFLQSPFAFAAANPNPKFIPPHWNDPNQQRLIALRGIRSLFARYVHYLLRQRISHLLYQTPIIEHQEFCCTMAERREVMAQRLATNAASNLAKFGSLLDAIAAHCARNGAHLVLFEGPSQDVDRKHLYRPWLVDYQSIVHDVAIRNQVTYVDLNQRLQLPESAYFDAVHLTLHGRDPWSQQFLLEVAQLRNGRS
jgi:hypothetical protein